MNRSWMRANRLSFEYEQGVMEFLELAESNAKKILAPPKSDAEKSLHLLFLCPCVRCANHEPKLNKKEIMNHLIYLSKLYTMDMARGGSSKVKCVPKR
ncbi:unnamed protein product [Lathyrus sativus]|nr:unnamed protein product [Lathyrus sativus]